VPYSADHKKQSRERIRRAAADLFCRYGFDQVSITQVMKHAKMTHGAFYAHFTSKGELYSEAIRSAAEQSIFTQVEGELNLTKIVNLIRSYLSFEHVNQLIPPCPLAFLSTDIAHRDKHVKASYEAVFNGMVTKLAQVLQGNVQQAQAARALAQQLVVNLVGTVSIARSLADPIAQQTLLDNTKERLISLMEKIQT
jgi:AcrR family transcriptional regulator